MKAKKRFIGLILLACIGGIFTILSTTVPKCIEIKNTQTAETRHTEAASKKETQLSATETSSKVVSSTIQVFPSLSPQAETGNWETILEEDFDSKNLDLTKWKPEIECADGYYLFEDDKFELDLPKDESNKWRDCVIYPLLEGIEYDDNLKISFTVGLEDSAIDGFIGLFGGCEGNDISWLSYSVSKNQIAMKTNKETTIVESAFSLPYTQTLSLIYENGIIRYSVRSISQDTYLRCHLLSKSIRFGGLVYGDGHVRGYIDSITIWRRK